MDINTHIAYINTIVSVVVGSSSLCPIRTPTINVVFVINTVLYTEFPIELFLTLLHHYTADECHVTVRGKLRPD